MLVEESSTQPGRGNLSPWSWGFAPYRCQEEQYPHPQSAHVRQPSFFSSCCELHEGQFSMVLSPKLTSVKPECIAAVTFGIAAPPSAITLNEASCFSMRDSAVIVWVWVEREECDWLAACAPIPVPMEGYGDCLAAPAEEVGESEETVRFADVCMFVALAGAGWVPT